MGNIQSEKQLKTGKSPAKGKNFIRNLNRRSSGRDNKKRKKSDAKRDYVKTPDSDNPIESDNDTIVFRAVGSGAVSDVTVKGSMNPAPVPSQARRSPDCYSVSDSVFTDPLTPLAVELNQCYYSAESSTHDDPPDPDLTSSERALTMPQMDEKTEDKPVTYNVSVNDEVMGGIFGKDSERRTLECNHEFRENRLKSSPGTTSFTLSKVRKVELPAAREPNTLDTTACSASTARHTSLSDAPLTESNVLRKVASLTLEKVAEGRQRSPKVPEKLNYQLYDKFEGQMLLNWFVSSIVDGSNLKSSLSAHDLRALGGQYCTHLLAAGVLRQIGDKDAPPENVFKPNLMYYWAHMEAPISQPVTPGRLQMPKWPPDRGSPTLIAQDHNFTALDNTKFFMHNNNEEINNIDEAKTVISELKKKLEDLQIQLEKYKLTAQIEVLNKNIEKLDTESKQEKQTPTYVSTETQTSITTNDLDKLSNRPVINIPENDPRLRTNVNNDKIIELSIESSHDNIIKDGHLQNGSHVEVRSENVEDYCKLNKIRDCNNDIADKNAINKSDDLDKEEALSGSTNEAVSTSMSSSELSFKSSLMSQGTHTTDSSERTPIDRIANTPTEVLYISYHTKFETQAEDLGGSNSDASLLLTASEGGLDTVDHATERMPALSPLLHGKVTETLFPLASDVSPSCLGQPVLSSSSQEPYVPPPPPMPCLVDTPAVAEMGPPPPPMPGMEQLPMPEIGPPPPPMPDMGPPLAPMPDMGPPPPPMPGMGPPPPPMPGMGPPPPPMPGMGPPPPPMPGMGPPPPPMPGMGPPPPPMPGMGPPPPPMPGMGPPPPPMPGMGPPPPPMPGMGPPPPPMPGMGPSPPPMPGMGPPPPPMPGMGPPPPPMQGSGPPPPAPGPVPFPAPPAGGWNSQRAMLRKTPIKPAAPMKPLYWTRILAPPAPPAAPAPGPAELEVTPLWLEIEEASIDNIDEFTDLFSRQVVKAPAKKKVEVKTKLKPVKILDGKRSQNVGILAQSLHLEFSEIENAIYNFDTSVVSLEALQQIYELRATDEELQAIKQHLKSKPEVPLDRPETFLYELSGIPHFAERISCFMFQAEFEDALSTIMHKLDNLKHTCEFLLKNESLKRLFAIILTLGNYMNGGNGARGQADGFGLEILAKLKDVKSRQSNITLLHFIVRTYMRQSGGALAPECVFPAPEPGDVARAAAVDFADVAAALRLMRDKRQACQDKCRAVLASSPESPAHRVDDAAPRVEDASHRVEDASHRVEDASHRVEDSSHRVEDAAPRFEDAAHRVEDAAHRDEDAAPRVEDAAPRVEDAAHRVAVFRDKMTSFLEAAADKLRTEEENLDDCRKMFLCAVRFYQFRPKSGRVEECEPGEFFSLWGAFCSDARDIFKKEEQLAIKERLKEAKKRQGERKPMTQPKKEGGLKARLQKLSSGKK